MTSPPSPPPDLEGARQRTPGELARGILAELRDPATDWARVATAALALAEVAEGLARVQRARRGEQ